MKLNPGTELEFDQYQKVNEDDFYSRAVVQYAKRWADLMETEMEAGASLPEIAERTSRQADTGSQASSMAVPLALWLTSGYTARNCASGTIISIPMTAPVRSILLLSQS